MANAAAVAVADKLDCIDEGWNWYQEACAQYGDPAEERLGKQHGSVIRWQWMWRLDIRVTRTIILEHHTDIDKWLLKVLFVGDPEAEIHHIMTEEPNKIYMARNLWACGFLKELVG